MTVVVFSVKPRARIAPRRRRYREIVARFDVGHGQKAAHRVPAGSGRPSRYSRRRWTRQRGHYRRFACGRPWRGETSREAAVSASDGAREAGLPPAALPPTPLVSPPPRARRARRDERLPVPLCVAQRRGGGGHGADEERGCENRQRHRAPRESQSYSRLFASFTFLAVRTVALRRDAPLRATPRASISPSPRVRKARPSCWPLVPVAHTNERASEQTYGRAN